MTALDVITLEEAKQALVVDFPDQNDFIMRLIQTSVARVEQYTCYTLYARDVEITSNCNRENSLSTFPIEITGVTNDGNEVEYKVRKGALKTYVECAPYSTIAATIGYTDRTEIPAPLIDACYKIITYLYQNRDAYASQLPNDIQLLLNQYRRGII